jgi:hypothetical protein
MLTAECKPKYLRAGIALTISRVRGPKIRYVARLEELKSRGEISEETYLKLKDEYWKRFEQETG